LTSVTHVSHISWHAGVVMQIDPDSDGGSASGDVKLARLADRQQAIVARWQLERLGLRKGAVDRRVARAQLRVVYRGVYVFGRTRLTFPARCMAAALACGPDAVISHHAAAALHDLRPLPHSQIDVTAPVKRAHKGIRCHVARTMPAATTIDAIPVTTLERTYVDYAEQATPRQLIAALEAGQRRNVLDLRKLQHLIDHSPGRRGITPLRAAIAQLTDDPAWTQSQLERDFQELIRGTDIPTPAFNVSIEGEVVDCAWIAQRLVVEIDGYESHKIKRQFEDDRRRDIKLQKLGWRVLRLTYDRIHHEPAGVLDDLRAMLAR
jgi:very-short-patch-repair endonuclease